MAEHDETTDGKTPPLDYEEIDGSALRDAENRAVRRLLERERNREHWCRSLRKWFGLGVSGVTALGVAHQAGFFDWFAGILVRVLKP